MNISSYSFGQIIIDKKEYNSDVIIYQDRIDSSWWRKKSHSVTIEDIADILKKQAETIIFGTGFYGMMKIENQVKEECAKRGINLIIEKSGKAVQIFNESNQEQKVIAALHLTC
ncbi:MAG: hypothetical protein HQ534_08155 [Armatimonadetes bacterium]|nr:hypothetical protein [Armatimonadota bacterium]